MPNSIRPKRRPISLLPNILTLANAGLGLLAISKAIDALALQANQADFERLLETSCWMVIAAGFFDILDGKVARLTNSFSDLGAQLDSLADALTFGVAPALIGKVLLEKTELVGPRIHFFAAAAFVLMAILRLARFNVETDEDDDHSRFTGLPSPAAAGMLVSTVLIYLSVGGSIEIDNGSPTPFGRFLEQLPGAWRPTIAQDILLPGVMLLMPFLGLLMVSKVTYAHFFTRLARAQNRRILIPIVFSLLALSIAPIPFLFTFGVCYVGLGLWSSRPGRAKREAEAASSDAA